MKKPMVRVLMLGEKAIAPSALLGPLARNACTCWFAASANDGIELFERHNFHVVLSSGPIREAMRMLPAMAGSHCNAFSAFPVERGSWWLPMMHLGRECIGAPAMRTAEFVKVLDEVLAQIRMKEPAAATSSLERSYFMPLLDGLASQMRCVATSPTQSKSSLFGDKRSESRPPDLEPVPALKASQSHAFVLPVLVRVLDRDPE